MPLYPAPVLTRQTTATHGDFTACTAFNPDGPLAGPLRTKHEIAMRDLYYGTDEPPTFDEVLDRVHARRALLDIEIAS